MKFFHIAAVVLLLSTTYVDACTNYLVSAGASEDGSTMISYAADSHTLYGFLKHFPAADHREGTMRKIYDWDTGKYLGEIPEANHTYNVIGNMNEHGVSIGETTYEGLEDLANQPGAIMDYGSLIYVALQRAATAQEAIEVMTTLANEYGYASSGESFSIADPNEVWIMEFIGKGKYEKGAVWVAHRVPEGYVCAHANQARIRQVQWNDTDNVKYAPDVVTFAIAHGYYKGSADDFGFSDVYNPITFQNARFCEVRAWSFFSHVADGMEQYLEYVKGFNLSNRMPLFVKPREKISLSKTMELMRDHLENTWFDFRFDSGAQAFEMPYRWRPLTWKYDGKTYLNERSVGTQQTGFSFVSQMRATMPSPLRGIIWFGVDDTASTVYAPMYGCMTDVPKSYAEGNGGMMDFTFDSIFWVTNMVTNLAYSRYELIHPEIADKIDQVEVDFFKLVAATDAAAVVLPTAQAVDLVTKFSVKIGDDLHHDWLEYWKHLFTKYMDGNVKTVDHTLMPPIKVEWPGYPDATLKRVVEETGDHYLVPSTEEDEVRNPKV